LWLTFLDTFSSIPWRLWELIYRSFLGAFIGWAIFNICTYIYAELIGELPDAFMEGETQFLFLIGALLIGGVALPVVALLLSQLLRSNRYAFGWEGLWSYALLRLKPSRYPNWELSERSRQLTLKSNPIGNSLRHSSFYKNSDVIAEADSSSQRIIE
jgi:hypothetical protein